MSRPFELKEKKVYKRMGYFSDQDGILRRYLAEAENWKAHLEHTKQFIIQSFENKERGKAAILGSGWLLDLPMEALTGYFREVWLFDIRHPKQVRHGIRKVANIRMVETDISGFALPAYKAWKVANENKMKVGWENIKPRFDFQLNDFDFVVSCNILDQLDDLPVEYLKRKNKISAGDEAVLRTLIQQTHLNCLPESKTCLIADMEEWQINDDNQPENVKKLFLADMPDVKKMDSWTWKFDTRCTYNPKYRTWFKVAAMQL